MPKTNALGPSIWKHTYRVEKTFMKIEETQYVNNKFKQHKIR